MDAPPQKRTKFSSHSCAKLLASKGRLPDVGRLSQDVKELPAPQAVREKFRGPPMFIGIDVETHALAPRSSAPDWRSDGFGFLTKAGEKTLSYFRLVQLR